MSLWELIVRSLSQRRLSSVLTALSVALGVMLVTAILILQQNLEDRFREPGRGYSLVVGAPGSPLQLVLNAVYHLERSPGLMPFSQYEELREDPSVALAVPYAVGDSFRGYRVVGTTDAFFHARFPHPDVADGASKFSDGRAFRYHEEDLHDALEALRQDAEPEAEAHEHAAHEPIYEAVVGAAVAQELGVQVGDRIEPTHGVESVTEAHEHEHLWTVVGVLRSTSTAVDDLVLINLDSFYRIPEHEGALIPGTDQPGISSVILFPRGGVHKAMLLSRLRRRPDIQVANVEEEIDKLFSIIGNIDSLFLAIAILVVVIGVLSILVAIYNTMAGRRRALAIMRAIGAPRSFVLLAIVGEATLLTFVGAIAGLVGGHLALVLASSSIETAAGFAPDTSPLWTVELCLFALVTAAGALAGLIPGIEAYRTDVASNLTPLA